MLFVRQVPVQDEAWTEIYATGVLSLNNTHQANLCAYRTKTDVVVAVGRVVVVTVSRPAVTGIIVPAAAAYDAVRACYCLQPGVP